MHKGIWLHYSQNLQKCQTAALCGSHDSQSGLDAGLEPANSVMIKKSCRLFYLPKRWPAQLFQQPALAFGFKPLFVSCPAWTRRFAFLW